MRPRKTDRHLPACVYQKHGAYWYVKHGRWTRLGTDLGKALAEYAKLQTQTRGGMAALIDQAMPGIVRGKAAQTAAQYQVAARRLKEMLAEFAPEQVKSSDVAQVRKAFADSPATANRTVTVLQLVFDYAVEEEIVAANPCIGVKRMPQTKRTRRITWEEYGRIYEVAKPRLRVVMDLCYLTGQRISDVLAIMRADLRTEGVYVEQQKTGARLLVAWTPELRAAVEAAKALHGPIAGLYLIKGRQGKPMAYAVAWKDWRAACKAAGVADANIHDLRAMSATEAKAQARDPQALLGHTDARTTAIYLRDHEVPVVEGPSFRRVQNKTGDR